MHVSEENHPMDLMTIREAAQLLRVSSITVRRHVATGRLPAVRVGRGIRIDRAQIERFATPVATIAEQEERTIGAGKILTPDSPLWKMIGAIDDDGPTDLSINTDAYLARAYARDIDE